MGCPVHKEWRVHKDDDCAVKQCEPYTQEHRRQHHVREYPLSEAGKCPGKDERRNSGKD